MAKKKMIDDVELDVAAESEVFAAPEVDVVIDTPVDVEDEESVSEDLPEPTPDFVEPAPVIVAAVPVIDEAAEKEAKRKAWLRRG